MSNALTINQNKVGKAIQFFASSQYQGAFPKRQQARNIGKRNLTFNYLCFDYAKLRVTENYHCSSSYAPSIRSRYINTSNKARLDDFPFMFSFHPFRQAQLYFPGLGN